MNKKVLIIGESGQGKSTSLMNLDPKTTFIIAVEAKELPFKSKGYHRFSKDNPEGNYYQTDNAALIINMMKHISENRKEITDIVIDDGQYIMGNEYSRRVQETGFKKFNDILDNIYKLLDASGKLREDLIVYFTWHPETDYDDQGNLKVKAKTVGKAVDKLVTIEGKFTIVLYSFVKKGENGLEYGFTTQNSGTNTCKSPMGMFDKMEIPNDLKYVSEQIRNYYK